MIRATAQGLGVANIAARPATESITQIVGEPEQIAFVLVDGLGMNLVRRMPPESFMATHLKTELLSIVPSTTACALTSLGTGVYPNQHAVAGWFTYLPRFQITTMILPFIERFTEVPLQERGIQSKDVFVQPSWVPHVPGDAVMIHPMKYVDSVYSRYLRGDTPSRGYETLEQALDLLIDHVQHAPRKSYAFVYLPQLDAASHILGPMHPEVLGMVQSLDAQLIRLVNQLDGRARLIVSADHGQLHVPYDHQTELFDGDPLLELLEVPPTGEARFPIFHVPSRHRKDFEAMFESRFGDRFVLLSLEEAEALALLGPGHMRDIARARFGQYLGIPLENHTLQYLPANIPPHSGPIGRHGAVSSDEMQLPLIVA
ncbi:MAG: alkaline phosphatase family protein [Anaerolineales bacterium]